VTYQPDPGTTLNAADALRSGQQSFTREQVAYLLHLAYRTGLHQNRSAGTAELVATWAAKHQRPPTRAERIAVEVAAMAAETARIHKQRGWPVDYEYTGGPVDWDTGLALRPASEAPFPMPPSLYPSDPDCVRPRFPTLEEQSAWLSPEDVAFCRRYARDGGRA